MNDWESDCKQTPLEKQILQETKAFRKRIEAKLDEKFSTSTFSKFGLCNTCHNLTAAATKYGIAGAKCVEFSRIQINTSSPITECTAYSQRNSLSLSDMIPMATLLDISRPTGFDLESREKNEEDGDDTTF